VPVLIQQILDLPREHVEDLIKIVVPVRDPEAAARRKFALHNGDLVAEARPDFDRRPSEPELDRVPWPQMPATDRGTALRPRTTPMICYSSSDRCARAHSRLFPLMVVLGELVLRVFVADRPIGAVLAEGQRPCPVENGGYPVAPADQVEDVNESPHRVAGNAGAGAMRPSGRIPVAT
jgi:hypothetical protein